MLAIELVADPSHEGARARVASAVVDAALERGLLLITCGIYGNCIRVLVPLVVTDAELEEALGVWEEALEATLSLSGRGPTGKERPLLVGDVLADRYELEELVGSGGMSTVYRAHDRVLERRVALKILHQQLQRRGRVRRALPARGAHGRRALAPRTSSP